MQRAGAGEMTNDLELARRLYAPSVSALRDNLPDMGASLSAACNALADDCSIERCDELAMRLKAGEQTLSHLRKALISEKAGVQRGGTG